MEKEKRGKRKEFIMQSCVCDKKHERSVSEIQPIGLERFTN